MEKVFSKTFTSLKSNILHLVFRNEHLKSKCRNLDSLQPPQACLMKFPFHHNIEYRSVNDDETFVMS
ncbi:CLUMA_CG006745, isoform A [Clunio marinus]|uniref:CLUMA_CG006745, isoform A n=1 Tax=Clunio marinus TaxID=568069 RepID=A0A1J1I495_9DIPT|nr:CLUMA_CG006745, isoform A [Clunio marinus]